MPDARKKETSVGTAGYQIRMAKDEWAAFGRFQARLQDRTPDAKITARYAFKAAVRMGLEKLEKETA
jgi:hypothetical protein